MLCSCIRLGATMSWTLHLHRYGGRAMCGRSIDACVLLTEDYVRLRNDRRPCRSCLRAAAADDARQTDEWRKLDGSDYEPMQDEE